MMLVFTSILALIAVAIAVVPVSVVLWQDWQRDRRRADRATARTEAAPAEALARVAA